MDIKFNPKTMSHPLGLEPDEVKDEDDTEHEVKVEDEPDDQPTLNAYYDEQKRMEDHFTKEPDRFGGDGTNWN